MKLTKLTLPPLPTTQEEVLAWAKKLYDYLQDFNEKVMEIPSNKEEELAKADTGNANAEFSIAHHLNRVPQTYYLVKTDKAASIYTGATAWTSKLIYLKCNVANAAITVRIY